MRTNLPVTQREYQFPTGETLLSTTDTDSRIAYANRAFIRTSGFTTEEIAGRPHNLVRQNSDTSQAAAKLTHAATERAGEQGRGFAVVASEVRSLAGRSAAAAKEIKVLIDESVKNVDNGSRLVADAGRTMGDVVGQMRRVNDWWPRSKYFRPSCRSTIMP